MAGFFYDGERKPRPGVYLRIMNRGADSTAPAYPQVTPTLPPAPSKTMLLKDSSGVLLKTSDGYYLAVKN